VAHNAQAEACGDSCSRLLLAGVISHNTSAASEPHNLTLSTHIQPKLRWKDRYTSGLPNLNVEQWARAIATLDHPKASSTSAVAGTAHSRQLQRNALPFHHHGERFRGTYFASRQIKPAVHSLRGGDQQRTRGAGRRASLSGTPSPPLEGGCSGGAESPGARGESPLTLRYILMKAAVLTLASEESSAHV